MGFLDWAQAHWDFFVYAAVITSFVCGFVVGRNERVK